MTRKIALLSVLVLAAPLTAFASGGLAGSVFNLITSLPEPGTLGLLGFGLISFAVLIRRTLKLRLAAV